MRQTAAKTSACVDTRDALATIAALGERVAALEAGNAVRRKRQVTANKIDLRSGRVGRNRDNHLRTGLPWQIELYSYRLRSDVKRLKVIADS